MENAIQKISTPTPATETKSAKELDDIRIKFLEEYDQANTKPSMDTCSNESLLPLQMAAWENNRKKFIKEKVNCFLFLNTSTLTLLVYYFQLNITM